MERLNSRRVKGVKESRSNFGCLIIAEVGQAHDGSLGTAHAFIDAIAKTGANAIKFQTHIAAAESSPFEPWRVKFSYQDKNRYDYWKRMEFSEDQWKGLRDHSKERGLRFLSSAFSLEAIDLLSRIRVDAWKIPSGEIANDLMFERISATRLPIILSSGMSSYEELDAAVRRIQRAGLDLTVCQCSSIYPTPADKWGLNVIEEIRVRYGCKAGFSDHSGGIFAGLAAATLGIDVLEVHVTLSREAFGPDVAASITTGELKQLADGVHLIELALNNPVDKNHVAEELSQIREQFNKSIFAAKDIAAGTKLNISHLAFKKPGSGIPAKDWKSILGREACQPIAEGKMIREDDLE